MVPFLGKEIQTILRRLLSFFIKHKELEKMRTSAQLLKRDIYNKTLLDPLKLLDIGFVTKQAVKKAIEGQQLQETQVNISTFKKECVSFLAITCKKILEKSHVPSCAAHEPP